MHRFNTAPVIKPQEIEDIALRIQSNMTRHVPHLAIFGKDDSLRNRILQLTEPNYVTEKNYEFVLWSVPTSATNINVFEVCMGTKVNESERRIKDLCDVILICVQDNIDIDHYQRVINPWLIQKKQPMVLFIIPEVLKESINYQRNSIIFQETDTKNTFYKKAAEKIEEFAALKLESQSKNTCVLV